MATAQVVATAPAVEIVSADAAALAALAHPLIGGALSLLAFTQAGLGRLRFTRALDTTGDVSAIKTHKPDHRQCRLNTAPAWARPPLAGARTHDRLAPPETACSSQRCSLKHVFCAHTERLPQFEVPLPVVC
ncbi:hypothetical protein ACWGGS_24460 [Streptomyces decoyicus]